MTSLARRLCVALLATLGFACGGRNLASQIAKSPEFDPKDQTKCSVVPSRMKPLVVEWPSADRGALEAQAKHGLVFVKYDGCKMEVLRQCHGRTKYAYTALTPKHDRVTIRDEDSLYANLPTGAAKLESTLKRAGQLNVEMTFVGTYESPDERITRDGMDGECSGATHVAYAMSVGAFNFYSGASASIAASAKVGGMGGGGASSSENESLASDGDEGACAKSARADTDAPERCSAPLRLELAPLGEAKPASTIPMIDLGEYPPLERIHPEQVGHTSFDLALVFGISRRSNAGFWRDRVRSTLSGGMTLPGDDLVTSALSADVAPAWAKYVAARDQLVRVAAKRDAKRTQRDACRAAGCPNEDALKKDLDAQVGATASAGAERARALATLTSTLEAQSSAARTPQRWFAIGVAHEVAAFSRTAAQRAPDYKDPSQRFHFEPFEPSDGDVAAAGSAYSEAAKHLSTDDRLGWMASYRGTLLTLGESPSDAQNKLEALARLPDRPESVVIHEKLGRMALAKPDADTLGAEGRWLAGKSDRLAQNWGVFFQVVAGCERRTWSDPLYRRWRELNPTTAQETATIERTGLLPIPRKPMGECYFRSGGLATKGVATLPDTLDAEETLIGAGGAALLRFDYSDATQIFEAYLAWKPQGLLAPRAIGYLVALYRRAGNEQRASKLEELLARDFAPGSLWAQRAKGNESSTFVAPALAPVPKTDDDRRKDTIHRFEQTVRDCQWGTVPTRTGATRIETTITLAEARPPVVTAKFLDGDDNLRGMAKCIEETAPLYFHDAANGVHAIAHVTVVE